MRVKTPVKKAPARVVRVNISIPAELKARMDDAGKQFNWSSIAAQAFEDEIEKSAVKQRALTMEQVARRLRDSRRRMQVDDGDGGFDAGRRWAMNVAEYADLHALAKAWRIQNRDLFLTDDDKTCAARILVGWLREGAVDAQEAGDFWSRVSSPKLRHTQHNLPRDTYVRAFGEGALEVWAEVEKEVS